MKIRDITFRVLGAILGITEVAFGIFFFFAPPGDGFYRAILVPLGFLIMGAYFLNYALTGRGRLFRPGIDADRLDQLKRRDREG